MVLESACRTSTGSASLAQWSRYACQRAPLRRCGVEMHRIRASHRRSRRPNRVQDLGVRVRARLVPPERDFVRDEAGQRVAADGSKRRGVDLDTDAVLQVQGLAGALLDE